MQHVVFCECSVECKFAGSKYDYDYDYDYEYEYEHEIDWVK